MSQFIGGAWVPGGGEAMSSVNPATTEVVWQSQAAAPDDVARAVAAAAGAFSSWRATSLEHRVQVLESFATAVMRREPEFARLISDEVGKPMWEATAEVGAVAAKVGHSIRAYQERSGVTSSATSGATAVTRHKALGVMAVFGPYNFPAHLPNGHIVPALLAGNTAVFKPSELTPAVGEFMVRIWESVGIPDGVLNLIQGGRDIGAALAAASIDGLLFTGSAATGALLHRQFADRPEVLLALEMGGNNPLIVIDGADLDAAVPMIIQSAYVTSGQRCTCARRLFVPRGAFGDQLISDLIEAAQNLTIGRPDASEQPFMGPVISAKAAKSLYHAQDEMTRQGAVPLLKMVPIEGESEAFVSPGLIDVTGVDVADEEHFGPLLTVIRYDGIDEAIAGANNTRFGLAAGVLGGERATYERIWGELRAGIVNWNRPTTGASSAAPFGGVGASGNHRPAAYYAADYSSYPVASIEADELVAPNPMPGQ